MRLRRRWILPFLAAAACPGGAQAADKPMYGPPAKWVIPQAMPKDDGAPSDRPITLLLEDRQLQLTPQADSIYIESAVRIEKPEGLQSMGTLVTAWNPDTDTLTIHKLHIIRGSRVIDALTGGQTFTILRRETNLEGAALDGTLTAALQPAGLQTGDIIDFAYTVSNADPVFKGQSEWRLILGEPLPITHAHMRAEWPRDVPIQWKASAELPGLKQVQMGGTQSVTYEADNVAPLTPVHGAPARFAPERRIDFTQFQSWAAMSRNFAPLYGTAAHLAPQSDVTTEINRINAAYRTPADRAGAALALVQDQVRYVFLGMNDGGLVPAGADLTWTRRFGDCKGKTALLLALLRGLGIEADPVLVKASGGDGLDTRLPIMSDFDHVLVRARIDGRTYWLDGTRTGDRHLADIAVPAFTWGLPLTAAGSGLVPITPEPPSQPQEAETLRIDARGGLYAPASFHAVSEIRGNAATMLRQQFANVVPSTLEQGLKSFWARRFSFVDVQTAGASFDESKGVERLTMDGSTKLQIAGRSIRTYDLELGRAPDFNRAPGPGHDAPFTVPFPFFATRNVTILLPDSGAGYTVANGNVDRVAGGVEYKRSASIASGAFTGTASARSLTPEIPAAEAQTATEALRELLQSNAVIILPNHYVPSDHDLDVLRNRPLTTVQQHLLRGNYMLDHGKFDYALMDFDAALTLDPHSSLALADRGLAYFWKDEDARAEKDIKAAAAIDPHNAVVWRTRGVIALKKGHQREAVAAFTQSLQTEPNNSFALTRRATAYINSGDDDNALTDIATLMQLKPAATHPLYLRAGIFRRRGAPEQAAEAARAIVAMAPNDAEAHVSAARIYVSLHREKDATAEFQRALAIKTSDKIYLVQEESRDRADVSGRRADIDAALKLDPHGRPALMALADLQSGTKDHDGAVATLTSAIAAHAHDGELLVMRGIEYTKTHQGSLAQQDFAAASALANTAEAENMQCWRKATAGVALEAALKDCDAALAKRPDDVNYLDSKGLVLLRLQRLDEAKSLYSRVIEAFPTASTSLFGRSIIERREGDVRAADDDLAMARRANPRIDERFVGFGIAM